jgi:two-component system chemotaxis response regulator CheB
MKNTEIVIVDDSRIFRSITERCLKIVPNVKVIASLWSGEKALEYIKKNHVDLITLDVEMPGIDGLETLRQIQEFNEETGSSVAVIMLSGLTQQGASATMEALEIGAFDFIAKPSSSDTSAEKTLTKQLAEKIGGWQKNNGSTKQSGKRRPSPKNKQVAGATAIKTAPVGKGAFELIVIGVSTGGPKALNLMLPEFCKNVNCPILIVQHMPPGFTQSLATGLDKKCTNYTVCEAKGDEDIVGNTVYIAPGGEHLVVRSKNGKLTTALHAQPPENGCRPSVDVLFRSVAQVSAGKRVLSIVLTGMGSDGAAGLRPLKRAGAQIIIQDEQSSVVWGMPGSALATGLVDKVIPLTEIPKNVAEMQK